MNRESKITIIGGGIGGLVCAISLKQKGFNNIQIFERRTEAQSIGAGFVVWANASWILNKLALLEGVAKLGGRLKQMQRWTDQGEYLGAVDITKIDQGIGYPSYAVSQAEFQQFLQYKANELGVIIRNNHSVIDIEDNSLEKYFLRFEDGSKVEADIVIGADGRMNSIARKYVQKENNPIYQNYINWVGILESDNPLPIENNVLDYWGCGARFGIVPISKYKVYWAGCKVLSLNSVNTAETDKEELLNIFNNWPALIRRVIKDTQNQNIKRIPVFDHNPNPSWFRNRVCLLGDAAHASLPTSGQGACQAMEDGWHLSEAMAAFPTLPEVFDAYQNIRFEKTTVITISAREFALSLFNTQEAFCLKRNDIAKSTDYEKSANGMIGLWSKNLK
ncbi:2-polyprenyl-6-methoxyphenol hydroxylase [Mucilaginibacter lappiensis]|uniref:2-polyprenyl-6-methoxyphenol hydroxylase-like FAD-dependent oxidoreductase n=1 Tax=Mucilaginibacter lappiensis TaxID=354630 RepID=A0ABR6PTH5_9SPHI|nr:FAD-dependent monooxygenase [Mucilaginibacter lappiensis]MBB6112926.1 2-polyprenyl-6-methoxyphenol hydroxylase-like FAD-dependent oxidoreductase [Mucilaginibacter lappiensis]SIS09320.1 2-polyprenyl-6-methoxyphenol hydroxylase [Mucilaginibacter lappiensis]